MNTDSKREHLNFSEAARRCFAFLCERGYSEIEVLPTLLRYRNGDLEVDVFHGRSSYEVGFGISRRGTRYSLSALIRLENPVAAQAYRNYVATTDAGIEAGLTRVRDLVERYGQRALRGDPDCFDQLETQRKAWSKEYAMDVLEAQVRPRAEEAFRMGNYQKSAELYEEIFERLTPAELKKLAFARRRAV